MNHCCADNWQQQQKKTLAKTPTVQSAEMLFSFQTFSFMLLYQQWYLLITDFKSVIINDYIDDNRYGDGDNGYNTGGIGNDSVSKAATTKLNLIFCQQ